MADKYVDLNTGEGFSTGDAGTSGDPFVGCYGMQKALDTVAAGETIFVTGTANLNKLVTLTVGADKTGTWVVGDAVRNNTGSGNHWTGVLCERTSSTMLIELDTGDYGTVTTSEGIENTTRSDTVTCSAKMCPGMVVDTTDGTVYLPVNIIGCNNSTSWIPGTLAVFDGVNTSHINYAINSTKIQYSLSFIEIKNCGSHGVYHVINAWKFLQCSIHNNAGNGVYSFWGGYSSVFENCKIYSNSLDGIRTGAYSHILFSKIYSNGNSGVMFDGAYGIVFGNTCYNNAYFHINLGDGDGYNIIGNILHGQTNGSYAALYMGNGVASHTVIIGNRITGNAGYGIKWYYEPTSKIGNSTIEDWNYFQSNTSGDRYKIPTGANSVSGSDTNYGYTDYTNGDFSLVSIATLRRTAINLDW